MPYERMFVSTTNTTSTLKAYRRTMPPPWADGNVLKIWFNKPLVLGADQEMADWTVANMHSENLPRS